MNETISLFDQGKVEKLITKPIRLIELFAGYGSQSLALDYLGVPYEHHAISEWAIKSIMAYADLHFDDDKDYSEGKDIGEIKEWLKGRISADYSTPLPDGRVDKLAEPFARSVYSDMIKSHNLGSILKIHGKDLNITDTDKYEYIMTYSFPCQDLSNSGKREGMLKGSGTRSGLLWEVERILDELAEEGHLPQVLLMENVPDVCGTRNKEPWYQWLDALERLGYSNFYKILNATEFKIPQHRQRCFMISLLGDYAFSFPEPRPLGLRLKDVLEKNVSEEYYLSDEAVKSFLVANEKYEERGNGFRFAPTDGGAWQQASSQEREADRAITTSTQGAIAPTLRAHYAKNGLRNWVRADGFGAPCIAEQTDISADKAKVSIPVNCTTYRGQ